jgi:hypothetical protein
VALHLQKKNYKNYAKIYIKNALSDLIPGGKAFFCGES